MIPRRRTPSTASRDHRVRLTAIDLHRAVFSAEEGAMCRQQRAKRHVVRPQEEKNLREDANAQQDPGSPLRGQPEHSLLQQQPTDRRRSTARPFSSCGPCPCPWCRRQETAPALLASECVQVSQQAMRLRRTAWNSGHRWPLAAERKTSLSANWSGPYPAGETTLWTVKGVCW